MEAHPTFTDEQTWQLVGFVKSLSGPPRTRSFTETYCIGCHGDWAKTGGLSLEGSRADRHSGARSDLGEGAAEGALRRDAAGQSSHSSRRATAAAFASFLRTTLDRCGRRHPNPGPPWRIDLNRAEYSNAVRDSAGGGRQTGEWLPVDDSGYGFDNIAAVLSTSPALLERYMSAAGKISRLAIGDPTVKPTEEIYDATFESRQGTAERAAQRGPAVRLPGWDVGEALFSRRRRVQHHLRFVADRLSR
jgi:hypothetical protein